jgi:hypothetical protein
MKSIPQIRHPLDVELMFRQCFGWIKLLVAKILVGVVGLNGAFVQIQLHGVQFIAVANNDTILYLGGISRGPAYN